MVICREGVGGMSVGRGGGARYFWEGAEIPTKVLLSFVGAQIVKCKP